MIIGLKLYGFDILSFAKRKDKIKLNININLPFEKSKKKKRKYEINIFSCPKVLMPFLIFIPLKLPYSMHKVQAFKLIFISKNEYFRLINVNLRTNVAD